MQGGLTFLWSAFKTYELLEHYKNRFKKVLENSNLQGAALFQKMERQRKKRTLLEFQ